LRRFPKALWWLPAAILFALGGLFLLAFYDRYWLWRACFNELGRCYDPGTEQVYLEQAGVAWGSLAAVCLTGGIFLALRAIRKRG
jgi:hypothetical protein